MVDYNKIHKQNHRLHDQDHSIEFINFSFCPQQKHGV